MRHLDPPPGTRRPRRRHPARHGCRDDRGVGVGAHRYTTSDAYAGRAQETEKAMGGPRDYFAGTERALYLYSRGTCYRPGCNEPVMKRRGDRQVCVVIIAHIEAAYPGGPRYRTSMTDRERAGFDNLILLCKPDHDLIDDHSLVGQYTVQLLRRWKSAREKPLADGLANLQGLTDESLKAAMEETVNHTNMLIESAWSDLKAQGNEVLTTVANALQRMVRQPFLTDDNVVALTQAADQITGLADFASSLSDSASRLQGLHESSYALHDSALKLQGLEDNSTILHHAAQNLDPERLELVLLSLNRNLDIDRLEGLVRDLQQIDLDQARREFAGSVSTAQDSVVVSIERMERAIEHLDAVTARARDIDFKIVIDDPKRQRYAWVGLFAGLLFGAIVLYLVVTVR